MAEAISQNEADYELLDLDKDRLEVGKTYYRRSWQRLPDVRDPVTGRLTAYGTYGYFFVAHTVVGKARKGTYGERVTVEGMGTYYSSGRYMGKNKSTDYMDKTIRYRLKQEVTKPQLQLSLFDFEDELS